MGDANRAVDVARDGEPPIDDLPREGSGEGGAGTGRPLGGLDAFRRPNIPNYMRLRIFESDCSPDLG